MNARTMMTMTFYQMTEVKAVSDESVECHPRWVYALRAGLSWLAFFFLGFNGGLVCRTALLIVIAVAGTVCLGAAKGSLAPILPSRPSAIAISSTVRLSDGTEIRHDYGSIWRDTGCHGQEYNRNFDGTFTRVK